MTQIFKVIDTRTGVDVSSKDKLLKICNERHLNAGSYAWCLANEMNGTLWIGDFFTRSLIRAHDHYKWELVNDNCQKV